SFGGQVVALLFVWLSLTPTLLPRGPFFHGVLTGVSAAIGYGVGVALAKWMRALVRREIRPRTRTIIRRAFWMIGFLGTVVVLVWFRHWQQRLRSLMDAAPFPWWGYLLTVVVAALFFVGLVALVRLLIRATVWLEGKVARVV